MIVRNHAQVASSGQTCCERLASVSKRRWSRAVGGWQPKCLLHGMVASCHSGRVSSTGMFVQVRALGFRSADRITNLQHVSIVGAPNIRLISNNVLKIRCSGQDIWSINTCDQQHKCQLAKIQSDHEGNVALLPRDPGSRQVQQRQCKQVGCGDPPPPEH